MKHQFDALTSLRGIGALCVVQHHAWIFVAPAWPESWIVWGFQEWPDYFFILSGFILTHVYGQTLAHPQVGSVRNYLVHRIARVYPLHLFMLVLLVAIQTVQWVLSQWPDSAFAGTPYFVGGNNLKAIPTNLLMIQAWGLHQSNSWNIPAWSVSAEFACYLLFPMMLRYRWVAQPVRAVGLSIACLVGLLWIQVTQPDFHVTYDFSVIRAFCSFALGCVLYSHRAAILSWLAWVPPTALQLMTILAILAAWSINVPGAVYIPLWFVLIAALTHEEAWVARLLAIRPLVWLGDRSYSLYMVHALILIPLEFLRRFEPSVFEAFLALPRWVILAAIFAAVIALSAVTYEQIENRGRRYLRQRFDRPNAG